MKKVESDKRKKLILVITCCLLLIIIIGGALFYFGKPRSVSGILYVNDKEVTSENVTIHSNSTDLPFVEMMKALGNDVEWIDDSTASIICKGEKYTLDLAEVTLKRHDEEEFNYIGPAPGSHSFHYEVLEKELVLDDNTAKFIMQIMSKKIFIIINREESIVNVTESID